MASHPDRIPLQVAGQARTAHVRKKLGLGVAFLKEERLFFLQMGIILRLKFHLPLTLLKGENLLPSHNEALKRRVFAVEF